MTSENAKIQSEDMERMVIRERFNRELKRFEDDLVSVDNRLNTFLGARSKHYGLPVIGPHLPFLATVISSNVDMITVLTWMVISYFTFYLIVDNYQWLDGKQGKIEFLSEKSKFLEKARNEGISIIDDKEAEYAWLQKYVIADDSQNGPKIKFSHPFEVIDQILRDRIRSYNWYTLVCLSIAISNYIVNLLPWLSPSMQNEAEKLGALFEFLPKWFQFLCIYNPLFSLPIMLIVSLLIVGKATNHGQT